MPKNEPLGPASTDQELMAAFQRGNEFAFEVLFERYAARVLRYAKGRLAPDLAEDVVQLAFMRTIRARHRYDSRQAFAPWLFSIVHRCILDQQRSLQRKQKLATRLSLQADPQEHSPDQENAQPEVAALLQTVSAREREALSLRYQHDMSYESLAKRLALSVAAARKVVSRAIQRLRSGQ